MSPDLKRIPLKLSSLLRGVRINTSKSKIAAPQKIPTGQNKHPFWVEGYHQGLAEFQKTAEARFKQAETLLTNTAGEIRKKLDQEIQSLEPQVVDLALAIAKSVIQKEVEKNNYDIQKIVRGVLSSLQESEQPLAVHVNPEDHKVLNELQAAPDAKQIRFVADPKIPKASCAVETAYGKIVREVDSLLQEIAQSLEQPVKSEAQGG